MSNKIFVPLSKEADAYVTKLEADNERLTKERDALRDELVHAVSCMKRSCRRCNDMMAALTPPASKDATHESAELPDNRLGDQQAEAWAKYLAEKSAPQPQQDVVAKEKR